MSTPDAFDTVIQLIYVLAASFFVLGLHLMNNPATARRGNQVSTTGMIIAIAATLAVIAHGGLISVTGWIVMAAGALVGASAGLYSARNVQMTAMPQLVSVFNAVGGGAAALGLTRLIAGLLYKVSPRDPLAFGWALVVMTIASLAACFLPAWRATRTDPVRALRD